MTLYTDEKSEKEKIVGKINRKFDKQKMKTESSVLERAIY